MKLASIERVVNIRDIPGADNIQVADIQGYQVVVKRNEFNDGDLCIFHNPDCIVDKDNPVYSFLKDKRLRIIKLRGQISQGLALPVSSFNLTNVNEGDDVTEVVKIIKYTKELPVSLRGIAKGNFPPFLVKTDEENLRSNKAVINELQGSEIYITQKVDGSSLTAYHKDGVFGVCSRNLDLVEEESNSFWRAARQYKLEEKLKALGNYALQAELYGLGLNGNKMQETEIKIAIFNLFDINNSKFCDLSELETFANGFELPLVKKVFQGVCGFSLQDLVELANKQEYKPGVLCEGIVVRPIIETRSNVLSGRLSVKVISEQYGLKHKE